MKEGRRLAAFLFRSAVSHSLVPVSSTGGKMSRRFAIYLISTFAISWLSWGLVVAQGGTMGRLPFLLLYALGGLGPTIAAYVAVLATRGDAPLSEFHARLSLWRAGRRWVGVALGLPVLIVLASAGLTAVVDPHYLSTVHLRSLYMFVPVFLVMILGGGLEELGWRGIAQPEAERRVSPVIAGLFVGLIWAVWHAPLFFIPGVTQYGMDFPIFAAAVIGNALLLAWLYDRTRSILLCIVFHASLNATLAMGFPQRAALPTLLSACLALILGAVLLLGFPARKA